MCAVSPYSRRSQRPSSRSQRRAFGRFSDATNSGVVRVECHFDRVPRALPGGRLDAQNATVIFFRALTTELELFDHGKVESGLYNNASEVIREELLKTE